MRRWLKFNLVGAIGIAVQLLALTLLTSVVRINYLPATALAVEAAVLHNFVWHEWFTWADRSSSGKCAFFRRLLSFNLSTGSISIMGNLVVMRLLTGALGWRPLAASVISIAVCSVANFLINELWVFRSCEDGPLRT